MIGSKKINMGIRALFVVLLFVSSLLADNLQDYKQFHKGDAAINWWITLYGVNILPPEDQSAVSLYTSGAMSSINSKLRAPQNLSTFSEEDKKKVSNLDTALRKTIIFENLLVFRYETIAILGRLFERDFVEEIYKDRQFTSKAKDLLEKIVGKIYKDYGFMSTTVIRNAVFTYRPIELVIKVPRLSDALFVALPGYTIFLSEYEVLFPRNRMIQFERFEISEDKKKLTLYAKMLGPCFIGKPCDLDKPEDNIRKPGI